MPGNLQRGKGEKYEKNIKEIGRAGVSSHHDACDDHDGISHNGYRNERGGNLTALTLYIYSSDENSTGTLSTNTYSLYQIAAFDVETDTNGSTVYTNIKVNSAYESDFVPATITGNTTTYAENSDAMKALAVTLKADTASDTAVATGITDGTVTNLRSGYYLLVETAHSSSDAYIATDVILVAADGTEASNSNSVKLKESRASITKKIVLEDSTTNVSEAAAGTPVDDNVVAFGDTVTYQLTAKIPNYPADASNIEYIITDELSDGLTYAGISSITIGDSVIAAGDYTSWLSTPSGAGGTLKITIPSATVTANAGKTVTVKFTATLNENANVGTTGNPNSVQLEYTNNWTTGTKYTTPKDSVITYTGSITIKKVDSANPDTVLKGAEFAIYAPKDYADTTAPTGVKDSIEPNGDGVKYYYLKTVTTGDDGTVTIKGLDAGTYYAVETDAPDGYSLDETPKKLVLSVSSASIANLETTGDPVSTQGNDNTETTYTVTWVVNKDTPNTTSTQIIENKKGTTLPGTGGIGTTLFTFGGLALVIIAAVMFIVYTKKQRKQA
ncbi:MAG: SpaH/EbpB family LPXTG-anchored major pilin [Clostridiales bacterium]|nr:SpaH/EbpB family LPXTG-anchored major pilin [Clostridiales bacterium]